MKIFKLILAMSILSIFSSIACAKLGKEIKNAHIVFFSYNYDGTIGGNSHNYEVVVKDSVATLKVWDMMHWRDQEQSLVLDADFMRDLEALCAKHQVYRWDGFCKSDSRVCDGHGFSLSVRYDNGRSIYAHGMNDFPNGFWDFDKEMHALFKPVILPLFPNDEEE